MNAVPRPAPVPAIVPDDTPLLRTLLLTDLCDSTEITEKRGDAVAAQIYRDLDRVVMDLQQRWRGRLIDRSDGLLLLFERPIDGLGFALDYMKSLKDVGARHDVELRARAGLHVGEVLTWRNSVEAVQLGAKPLEVEGLTKPMAARLMTLARPGQILVSAIAEPLAHRAARELGERGDHLLWKSHGYWCFKGVPGRQEVHEVGEAGLAPLRAPRNGPKAWRDIPLWRRPASLAAEVLLLAGLGIGGWYATRPEPAIAFAERDWVVMGDLRNLTGDPRLDESLEQAFRISLEQSRYVNVLSDLKARETLQRMQKPEGTAIDRATASEIAVRDGVRAVILPTVSEVGGRLRVSAEVVDPRTQSTVYVESADGKGIDSALASVDQVTGALRGKLGEALAVIERDSKPLPQVTTSNIDALKAYSLAEQAFAIGEYSKAKDFYKTAIALDEKFALAYLGVLKSDNAIGALDSSSSYLAEAKKLVGGMSWRDQMYLKGWVARIEAPDQELAIWKQMASLYPDDYIALMNSGLRLWQDNRFAESLSYAEKAAKNKNGRTSQVPLLVGYDLLGLGRFSEAINSFDSAFGRGMKSAEMAKARACLVGGCIDDASKIINKNKSIDPLGVGYDAISLYLMSGDNAAAYREAQQVLTSPDVGSKQAAVFVMAVAEVADGRGLAARKRLNELLVVSRKAVRRESTLSDKEEVAYVLLQAANFAENTGYSKEASQLHGAARSIFPYKWSEAINQLEIGYAAASNESYKRGSQRGSLLDMDISPFIARFSLLKGQIKAGDMAGARVTERVIASEKYRIPAEIGCGRCQQPAAILLLRNQKVVR